MPTPIYSADFFAGRVDGSTRSAREILKIVKETLNPSSVVDIGCGTGAWLKVWLELGVEDILGIDGDYVLPDQLLVPLDRFRAMDLSRPTELSRQFDLVQSLEVAEHLPEEAAGSFISFLCSLGPVVLFSAAIPLQGGANHVNEQWPEYWAKLFLAKGYVAIDNIRDRVWDHPDIDFWYCQNTLVFVRADNPGATEKFGGFPIGSSQRPLSRVHPRLWLQTNEILQRPLSLERLIKMLPLSTRDFAARIRRKIKRTSAK